MRDPITDSASFPDMGTPEYASVPLYSAKLNCRFRYTAYADSHLEELITKCTPSRLRSPFQDCSLVSDRYHPDILWNDIGYPKKGRLLELLALYFNTTSTATINSMIVQISLL